MDIAEVHAVLDLADELGIDVFVSGGWGVDALFGEQTREHRDLDISLDRRAAIVFEEALTEREFELVVDWSPGRRAWRHSDGREVDVHPLELDDDGTHRLHTMDGQTYEMPPGSYVHGVIGGRNVRCLSVAKQLEFHMGYEPSADDLHDVDLLRRLDV